MSKYIAEVTGCEVTLIGSAELSWWRNELAGSGAHPYDHDGRAEVMVGAIATKFRGVSFSELVVSVSASRGEDGASKDGIYLAHAYSSSRLFTFFEKYWFKTPYEHADVVVGSDPAALDVSAGGNSWLEAKLSEARSPASESEECWKGPIYLASGHLFDVKLAGWTTHVPFDETDILQYDRRAFRWLAESEFQPREWSLRPAAEHARAKTVRP